MTEDWYFWQHRVDLARAARGAGFQVLVATRVSEYGARIVNEGFSLIPIRIVRGGMNPFTEGRTVIELVQLYRKEQPHIVHHVALKPVLYGSVAARLAGIQAVVNAFGGLGHAFISNNPQTVALRRIVGMTLRWSTRLRNSRTIFQNMDDWRLFVGSNIVRPGEAVLIRGAGVDVSRFVPCPEPGGESVVVLAGRMLRDKGVGEFVTAARLLKEWGIRARCVLVGMVDEENPANIPTSELRRWQEEGIVDWLEYQADMPRILASAHIVVLPSYREGLPKVLLEAAACARPIVATDVPGCREIVRHEENGLLVPPRNPEALARAIARLLADPALRTRMGARGRDLVTREFATEVVTLATLAVYDDLLKRSSATHN